MKTAEANNLQITGEVDSEGLHILTRNRIASHFPSAADRVNVSILSDAHVAISQSINQSKPVTIRRRWGYPTDASVQSAVVPDLLVVILSYATFHNVWAENSWLEASRAT